MSSKYDDLSKEELINRITKLEEFAESVKDFGGNSNVKGWISDVNDFFDKIYDMNQNGTTYEKLASTRMFKFFDKGSIGWECVKNGLSRILASPVLQPNQKEAEQISDDSCEDENSKIVKLIVENTNKYDVGDVVIFNTDEHLLIGIIEGYYIDRRCDDSFWYNIRTSSTNVYTYTNKGDICEWSIIGKVNDELRDQCIKEIGEME